MTDTFPPVPPVPPELAWAAWCLEVFTRLQVYAPSEDVDGTVAVLRRILAGPHDAGDDPDAAWLREFFVRTACDETEVDRAARRTDPDLIARTLAHSRSLHSTSVEKERA